MSTVAIDRATQKLASLRRTDIDKGGTMTDAEFETEKQKVLQEIARIPKGKVVETVGKILKNLPNASFQ